jgi:hypothetical protein
MNKLFLLVFILMGVAVSAQHKRQMTPIFVQGTAFKNTGWFVAPGMTYMLPLNRKETLTGYYENTEGGDTLYSGDFSRAGKIGAYLEAGRHKFYSGRVLLDHLDYGIHYKMLRGRDNFDGAVFGPGGSAPIQSNSKFSDNFLGAFINASNILQISDKFWIQNSLGANAEYAFIARRVAGPQFGAPWEDPGSIVGQLHYKLSFGWKPEPGMYIVPSIETPILGVYPWYDLKSTLPYYTGKYRPFIFTIRIQWLSMSSERKCENQPGRQVDTEKAGKHKSNDLWGPQDKKMERKRKKH